MRKITLYILSAIILAGCTESQFDASRTPSLHKRYLVVSTTALDFGATASTKTVEVKANATPWQTSIPVTWVSASPSSGSETATVSFTAQDNPDADNARVCVAEIATTVSDWDVSYPVVITQRKAQSVLSFAQSEFVCAAIEQDHDIALNSNCEYSINNTGEEWLHILSNSANGITLHADENNSGGERTAIITITAKSDRGTTSSLTVRQKKAGISSSTATLTFNPQSTAQSITVYSDAAWNSTASAWLSVSPASGPAGTQTVVITAANNASVNSRTGSVYFTIHGDNNIEVPVAQKGVEFSLSKQEMPFTSFASSYSFDITSNVAWSVTSKPEWITLSNTSGEGNGSIQVSVGENNTSIAKNGKIEIATADGVISKTIAVSQEAKTIDFADKTLTYNYTRSAQTVTFTTDGSWTVTKDADWITIDKQSGSGNGSIAITTDENMTLAERRATVTVNIADKVFTIGVRQQCKNLTLSSSAFDFSASGGQTSVSITSNTSWTASIADGADWLTITPASGTGNANISISAAENATATARTGRILVEIPGVHTYVIDITQAHKYIKTDMASVDFTQSGGQLSFTVTSDGTWEASRLGTWFGYTRSGNVITVVVPENNTEANRTGAITLTLTNVTGGIYSVLVPVTQTASDSVGNAKESGVKVEFK